MSLNAGHVLFVFRRGSSFGRGGQVRVAYSMMSRGKSASGGHGRADLALEPFYDAEGTTTSNNMVCLLVLSAVFEKRGRRAVCRGRRRMPRPCRAADCLQPLPYYPPQRRRDL